MEQLNAVSSAAWCCPLQFAEFTQFVHLTFAWHVAQDGVGTDSRFCIGVTLKIYMLDKS